MVDCEHVQRMSYLKIAVFIIVNIKMTVAASRNDTEDSTSVCTPGNRKCYYMFPNATQLTFEESKTLCDSRGTTVATIENDEDMQYLSNFTNSDTWLGGERRAINATWLYYGNTTHRDINSDDLSALVVGCIAYTLSGGSHLLQYASCKEQNPFVCQSQDGYHLNTSVANSWYSAKKNCEEKDMTLAYVPLGDGFTGRIVEANDGITEDTKYWIGLVDHIWVWVDGTEAEITSNIWAPSFIIRKEQRCLSIRNNNNKLSAEPCSSPFDVVCQQKISDNGDSQTTKALIIEEYNGDSLSTNDSSPIGVIAGVVAGTVALLIVGVIIAVIIIRRRRIRAKQDEVATPEFPVTPSPYEFWRPGSVRESVYTERPPSELLKETPLVQHTEVNGNLYAQSNHHKQRS